MIHLKLHILCILVFIAIIDICRAQQLKPYKTVDRHCKDCSEMIYGGDGFELKNIRESRNDIEIRFIVNGEHISRSITVIKGRKGKFTAAYYFQYFDMFPPAKWPDSARKLKQWEFHPFKRFEVDGIDLDTMVNRLIANKLLVLPEQKQLVPNAGYYRQYGIETKVNGVVRQYYFGNLNQFMLNYPDIPEFKSYLAIVAIFREISIEYFTEIKALKPD